jgi:hypothetical protein
LRHFSADRDFWYNDSIPILVGNALLLYVTTWSFLGIPFFAWETPVRAVPVWEWVEASLFNGYIPDNRQNEATKVKR